MNITTSVRISMAATYTNRFGCGYGDASLCTFESMKFVSKDISKIKRYEDITHN